MIKNDKRRAALIINALDVTDNEQVENKYNAEDYIVDIVEDPDLFLYDEDYPDEGMLKRRGQLNRIEEHHIINVEFENHLPVSITLTAVVYPITSIAFMGVIKKVFFGDPKEWIYDKELYKEEHSCLDSLGIHIPESVFQYEYYFCCVLSSCNVFEWFFSRNNLDINCRLHPLLNRLRDFNEDSNKQKYIQSVSDVEMEGEDKKIQLDDIILYGEGVVTDRNIVLFTAMAGLDQGGLFFNEGENRFMGFYWSEYATETNIYRSLPDYVNSRLSTEIEYFFFIACRIPSFCRFKQGNC